MPSALERINGDFGINQTQPGDQAYPDIVRLANGSYVVVWEDRSRIGDDRVGSAIKAQFYDASGAPQGEEFLVNSVTQGSQSKPSIAALAGGGFVIVWSDDSSPADGAGRDVKAQLFSSDGSRIGSEFLVTSSTGSDEREPDVTALSTGGFAVAWMEGAFDSNVAGISAQRFDASGTKVGNQFSVPANPSNVGFANPAISETGANGLAIVHQILQGTDWILRTTLFDAGGTFVANRQLNTFNGGDPAVNVAVVKMTNGNLVAVWQESSTVTSGKSDIVLRIVNSSGQPVTAEIRVNTEQFDDQIAPAITLLDNGGFAVSWADNSGLGGDSSGYGIKIVTFSDAGVRLGDEVLVNGGTANNQVLPAIAPHVSGGVFAVWQDGRSGTGTDIYGQILDIGPIEGTEAGEYLEGTSARDRIFGFGGDDIIYGLAGDDDLFGGDGNDYFNGGAGSNLLVGGSGNDAFQGGEGNDTIHGGDGEDILFGEGGDDTLTGETDHDRLYGGAGSDNLTGGDGSDWLTGDSGSDMLIGGAGDDLLRGGDDADTLIGGLGIDVMYGGEGTDVFIFNSVQESTSSGFDVLGEFDYAVDRISIGDTKSYAGTVNGGTLSQETLDADIAAVMDGVLTADSAAFFTADSGNYAGRTFLVIDSNGVAGYQAGADFLIEMRASDPTPMNVDFIG